MAMRTDTEIMQGIWYADYVDLIHLAKKLPQFVNNPHVEQASKTVAETTAACILTSEPFGQSVQDANGLSVWFPAAPWTYFNYRAKYIGLNFAINSPGWLNFLDAYFTD